MKYLSILFFFSIIFSVHYCIAQKFENIGYLRLRLYGSNKPLCRLDTTGFKTKDTVMVVASGKHSLRVWLRTFNLIDTTIIVKTNDTAKYSLIMKHDPAYFQYKDEYNDYSQRRNQKLFVSPVLMGLAIGGGLLVNKFLAEKEYDKAKHLQKTYSQTGNPLLIEQQKSEFEGYKNKYNNYKNIEYVMYAVSGLIAVNYIRVIIKQRKVPVPVYKQEELLSRINFNACPVHYDNNWLCGVSMNFKIEK